jgi:hypothetical protein
VTASSQRNLVCARCGASFACGADDPEGRCWCADEAYRLPMPTNADQDCMCPKCLRAHAIQSSADPGR